MGRTLREPHHSVTNQRGSGMIMGVIMLAAIMMSFLAMSSLIGQQKKGQQLNAAGMAARIHQQNIIALLSSDLAWEQTRASTSNVNLACMRDLTAVDCRNFRNRETRVHYVYNAKRQLKLDSRTGRGLNFDGEVCTTYVAAPARPVGECVFRFTLTWEPECESLASCVSPEITFRGYLDYNPGRGGVSLNEDTYEFEILRTEI